MTCSGKLWLKLLPFAVALWALFPAHITAQTCGSIFWQEKSRNYPESCSPATNDVSRSITWNVNSSTTCSGTPIYGEGGWTPAWSSGTTFELTVTATGKCACLPAAPNVGAPYSEEHSEHYDSKVPYATSCTQACECVNQVQLNHVYNASTCTSAFCCGTQSVCESGGNRWDSGTCTCMESPLMLDLEGYGLDLSSASKGVLFDLNPGLPAERVAWPARPSVIGFIVDDRNGNGVIDSGLELLGSSAPQARGGERNGFNALALYDENGDAVVSAKDSGFDRLQIWFDRNRDGRSQQAELLSLSAAGVIGLSLRYQDLDQRDEWGNVIAYRSRSFMRGPQGSSVKPVWLYDAFLRTELATSSAAAPAGAGGVTARDVEK